MKYACFSENAYCFIKLFFASLLSFDARIVLTTSSKIEIALINPSTICKRSFALSKLYKLTRVTTKIWKSI